MIDAPDRPAETHPHSPYDTLRPALCTQRRNGRVCMKPGPMIDWSRPGPPIAWKCVCGANNTVVLVEVAGAQSAGPL